MLFDRLHEAETVTLTSHEDRPIAALQLILLSLGFILHEDVFSMDRVDKCPPWQSTLIIQVELLLNGIEVFDLDGNWNELRLRYLFASVPSDLIDRFCDTVMELARRLQLTPHLNGHPITRKELDDHFRKCLEELESEFGETPGSESVAILIQSTYPRKPRE